MAAPSDEIARVRNLRNALDNVESQLAPILSIPRETLTSSLGKLEKCKLSVAIAYTMASLFFVLLKTHGEPTAEHEVMSELKRVGSSLQKVKAAAAVASGEVIEQKEQPRIRVDTGAGKRIVSHVLASNSSLAEQPAPFGGRNAVNVTSNSAPTSDAKQRVAPKQEVDRQAKKQKKHQKSAIDYM